MTTPADLLEGLELAGGWRVVRKIPRHQAGTGGNFSVGYEIEAPDHRRAFLKALDFSRALKAPDPARALQGLVEGFNFERDLLERCRDRRLRGVVTVLGDGTVDVHHGGAVHTVQYLILELAEGDVRKQISANGAFSAAWLLRSLHQVAVGIEQLHRAEIAHQDIKPSNVLLFEGGTTTKLTDLGRAALSGRGAPHDVWPVAGDPSYAPLEQLYRYVDPDWSCRRLGCDLYLLGSMAVFYFMGVGMTQLVQKDLAEPHRAHNWTGSYWSVLPYVRASFARVLEALTNTVDGAIAADVVEVVAYLCEPDPNLRGHPRNRIGHRSPYSLERFIARFDLMARRAEAALRGG